jgi:hypothetical protein
MAASSFTVVADPSGRVLHLLVTGDIGMPDSAAGMRDTVVDVGLADSLAPVIVDLRRATLAEHPDARDILRERVTRWATNGIPERRVAFVATAGDMRDAIGHIAALLTAHGYSSAVFEDDQSARRWAEQGP